MCIPPHSTPAWRSLNVVILRWVHPDGADALPGVAGSGALESEGRWMDGGRGDGCREMTDGSAVVEKPAWLEMDARRAWRGR